MIKRMLILMVLMALPALAWAHTCPAYEDMINESLEMAEEMGLSDETVTEIESLRDEGMRHHEEGDHDTAIALLDEALSLIESGG
ncbi:hypothetical protein VCB98_04835 [Gammaproteobacteria bacterium AB-CW1]|uniref:Uncharacterized protein n=1 Tax=Natronospira elongata TaxID=3110268 RepID=A0AAP6JEK8_9GAMM|nr:hypothetical protein [Gammaproteobacteria bacterium AB-CW1]